MTVTLHSPNKPPRPVAPMGFDAPSAEGGHAHVSARIALELGCALNLVDVLDSGPGYCAYSIFDSEEELNETARMVLQVISQYPRAWDSEDGEDVVRGSVLIIQS